MQEGDCVYLDKELDKIRKVLAHWGCPDPEIKLMPVNVFADVHFIISENQISGKILSNIHLYAPGLHSLIVHDHAQHPDLSKQAKVSSQLLALLATSLDVATSGLKSKSTSSSVSRAYEDPFDTPFEAMVKTASYFPNRPVIRTFPWLYYDYLNKAATNKRRELQEMEAKAAADKALQDDVKKMGNTCNKFKTTRHVLLPGIFTVFCAGCGMCEGFEMMPVAESPMTAFHVFAHRAWTCKDDEVFLNKIINNTWEDFV